MKYRDWLNEWLELYVKPSVKPKTFSNYAAAARLYIHPRLGNLEMKELDGLTLQRFVISLFENGNVRTGGGLAAASVAQIAALVERSLLQAAKTGQTTGYVEEVVKPRTQESTFDVKCFTVNEQKAIEDRILQKSDGTLYGILITLYTGLRVGELLALTWEDIDLTRGFLSVSKTCRDEWKGGYKKIIGTPKTPSSYRLIPIPRQLMPYLRKLKKTSKSEYVISGKNNLISVRSYQRTFERLLKKLKIPHRGFHALRHTFATRAIENNVDIKTLSEVMGHKSPTVTLTIYAHSLAPHKRSMMNKLGRLLTGTFNDEPEE